MESTDSSSGEMSGLNGSTMITKPLSIAVIGAGPSGLFFCHAIEFMMQQTRKECHVTCFEKSSQPGGIWRSAGAPTLGRSNKHGDTCMYEQLWSNGASHLTEFFDYTYDEHFGHPVSVYMKRQDILDYTLGRVQKNCPHFLEKYVQLRTLVEHVGYDDARQKFDVSVKRLDSKTPATEIHHFDKCIWACGENGQQDMPNSLLKLLLEGGYQGRIIHSSDTSSLEDDVQHKRILLIGGGLSAEDLALQAIKLKAQKVYICTRKEWADVSAMNHWPMNKVDVHHNLALCAVTENGRCLQFIEVSWSPRGYEPESDDIELEIRDIDTIIFCTGYRANLDMLDPTLRQGFPEMSCKVDIQLNVPSEWTMPPNVMSEYVGDIPVHDTILHYKKYSHPNYYRGVLIDNPNIMFITTYGSETPLLACDAYAWLFAGYITGYVPIPTAQRMREIVHAEALNMMKFPMYRYNVDLNYFSAVEELEGFWPDDPDESTPWDEAETEHFHVSIRILARAMREGRYPLDIGTFEQLNEVGEKIFQYGLLEDSHRTELDPVGDEKNWKTFRDVDEPDKCCSFFTGSKAVPLEKPWMEIVDLGHIDDETKLADT
jgi:Flavin-binding monooxygenase-like